MITNPRSQSVVFDFGVPILPPEFAFGPNYQVQLRSSGKPIQPIAAWYGSERKHSSKGEKGLVRIPSAGTGLFWTEEAALAQYDRVFVIDTNSKKIDGEWVSVSSMAVCTLREDAAGPETMLSEVVHVGAFEFRGLPENQERFGWILFQHAIVNGPSFNKESPYLMVTDHALSEHHDINEQKIALFDDVMLHPSLSIGYATSESGSAFLQRVIRKCDRMARTVLESIRKRRNDDGLLEVVNAPVSRVRFFRYPVPGPHSLAPRYVLANGFPYPQEHWREVPQFHGRWQL
jgi:hypothetical protein